LGILKKIVYYLIILLITALIVIGLLSLVYDLKYWYSKVLDFPRLQYLILGFILMFIWFLINRKWNLPTILLTLGLISTIIIQSFHILPYYVGEKKVHQANRTEINEPDVVSILIANVLIDNHSAEKFIDIVDKHQPDLLLAMEVDQWWIEHLKPLKKDYPYLVEYPLSNAYGIALYSKLALTDKEIRFLNKKDVPSIFAQVKLPSNKIFSFYGVHPVAPVPSSKYPDNEGEEEVELIRIGKIVEKDPLPAIVAGDFNDVSWSNTGRMFEDHSQLKNVRLGRGLFNSFNSKSMIMRWPLDHFFVSPEFSVVQFERLGKFNSDHFPLFAEFLLDQ